MARILAETLENPNPKLVRHYAARFDQDPRIGAPDRALSTLVELFPKNVQLEQVLLKVSALNGLYSTNIFAVTDVAIHLYELDIDPLLAQGDTQAVDRIARVEISGKVRRNYSFATKYCSMHMPEAYPIYDTIVDELLWRYSKRDHFAVFRHMDLWEYAKFKEVLDQFVVFYGLSEFDYKTLDKFLWSLGKEALSKSEGSSA